MTIEEISFRIGRDAKSGQFITVKEANKRPKKTVVETIKRSPKKPQPPKRRK